jgi:hypothetical protein
MEKFLSLETLIVQDFIYYLEMNLMDYIFFKLYREEEIAVRWEENRFINLFDSYKQTKLIYVQLQSLRYYQPLLKALTEDCRVKQLFNVDLLHVQQYLFTKLRIEPTSKVKEDYDGSTLLGVGKIDDEDDVYPAPFSILYFDLHTYSGILALDDVIRVIKVRYEQNETVFYNSEENIILQQFSDYVHEKEVTTCLLILKYKRINPATATWKFYSLVAKSFICG